jgi:hypothetical protein
MNKKIEELEKELSGLQQEAKDEVKIAELEKQIKALKHKKDHKALHSGFGIIKDTARGFGMMAKWGLKKAGESQALKNLAENTQNGYFDGDSGHKRQAQTKTIKKTKRSLKKKKKGVKQEVKSKPQTNKSRFGINPNFLN